jgi:hypothetical protein
MRRRTITTISVRIAAPDRNTTLMLREATSPLKIGHHGEPGEADDAAVTAT